MKRKEKSFCGFEKKMFAVAVLCLTVVFAGMMTGCSGNEEKTYDLGQVYTNILESQPEGSEDLSGVMFETADKQVIEEFYPGLGEFELNQEVYFQHAITGFCEIMLVEAADKDDVQAIADIFYKRIDLGADDSFYPETAQLWAENAEVQIEGRYVAMVALPNGYIVPEHIFS